jgi:peptidoglycan hydrolase CwlO-like protein
MKALRNIFIVVLFVIVALPALAFDVSQCNREENEKDCRARLDAIAEEIEKLEGSIQQEDAQQKTLSSEISRLTSDINKTSNEISKKNSLIADIKNDIVDKEKNLESLNIRLAREKESLSKILRKRYELEDSTILEYLLSAEQVSAFYEDAPAFAYVQDSLSESFRIIDELKVDIYGQKRELEEKRKEEDQERYNLSIKKDQIEDQKKDRDRALSLSETKEASFAELKKMREEEARRIRAELIKFQGSGITSRSISFGEAYDYAVQASQKTGVDPAFIMAIMQQETGFGNNVGGCYLKNGATGEGIYIKTGNPSKRNIVPGHFEDFKRITGDLGRDWSTTPISCAIVRSDGSYYGYGGAMGYTQFIPGTWAMVENRVESYLGVVNADPWNPEHAVMATAVFMMDRGASGSPSSNYNAYYNAACRYYGACSTYASSVMSKTANIQSSIDKL